MTTTSPPTMGASGGQPPPPSQRLGLLGLQSRILELVDTAIIAVDLEGNIIYANTSATHLYGWSRDELVGTSAARLMPMAIEPDVEAEIAAALSRGSSWEGSFEVRRKDGRRIRVHAVDSPLYGPDGELAGIVSAGTDATKQFALEELARQTARAGQISQFLADCGSALAAWSDDEEAIGQLGRSSVPFLGDVCMIDVLEGSSVRRVVVAHHDPARRELVEELEYSYSPDPAGPHPAIAALRTGATSVSAEMSDEFLRATTRDERHYEIVKELDFQSFVCVPLLARGRTLGALTLISCDKARRFTDVDVALAQEVAWRASLIIDNARLLTESSHVSQVLQASLMPPSLPEVPGLEVAARYVALGSGIEVGGDFYDLFGVGRGAWVVALGDVCGRGPEAAVVTGLIRHTLRTAGLEVRRPGRLVEVANAVLLGQAEESTRFSSLLCGVLRPQESSVRLALANAGHPPPFILRADGSMEVPPNSDTVIGVFADRTWTSRNLTLRDGDLFFAYTDGIAEARRGSELFGEARIAQVLSAVRDRPIEEIADRLIGAVRAFAGEEPSDDLALIALRVRPTASAGRVGGA